MKADDIQVNKTYTNGRGGFRKVITAGSSFKLYDSQANCDTLRYVVTGMRQQQEPTRIGEARNITRIAFARWAKREANASRCCDAPCSTEGTETLHHVCTKCGEPCDRYDEP